MASTYINGRQTQDKLGLVSSSRTASTALEKACAVLYAGRNRLLTSTDERTN